MVSFTKKEVLHLIFATLALAFVFGFDDKRPSFQLSFWFLNYFRVCLISASVVLSYALTQKLAANHYGCSSEFSLWSIQRYGFKPYNKLKNPLPVGIIIGILVAFLSAGKFFFAPVGSFNIIEQRHRRVGRRYVNITSIETAKIALSGVFAALLLAFLFSAFHFSSQSVLIASLFAVFQILPIPSLDGIKVFFASLAMFAFSAAFVVLSALLVNLVNAGSAFFYSLVAAGIFSILFFYYRIYAS